MKKALSLMLVLSMLMSIMPAPVFSEEFFEEESFASGDAFESFDAFEEDFFAEEPDDSAEATVDEVQADEQLEEETVVDAAEVAEPVPEEQEALDEETEVEEAEDTANEPATEEAVSVTVYASVKEGVILYKDAELTEAYGTVSEDSVVEIKDQLKNTTEEDVFVVSCVVNDVKTDAFLRKLEAEVLTAEDVDSVVSEGIVVEIATSGANDEAVVRNDDISASEAFSHGYAKVQAGTSLYFDAQLQDQIGVFKEDSVVFAVERRAGETEAADALQIKFTVEDQEHECFILASDVTPVNEDSSNEISVNVEFTETYQKRNQVLENEEQLEELVDRATNVKEIKAEMIDGITVKLSWLAPSANSSTDDYDLFWAKDGNFKSDTTPNATVNYSGKKEMSYELDLKGAGFDYKDVIYFKLIVNATTSAHSRATTTSIAFYPAKPDPEKVTVEAGTGTEISAVISWDAVDDVDGYKVTRIDKGGSKETVIKDKITGTSIEDKTIKVGKEYVYRVYTYGLNNKGSIVYSEEYASSEYQVTPNAPTNVKAVSKNLKTLTVTWDKVDGATGYWVSYKKSGEEYTEYEGEIHDTSFDFTAEPAQAYTFIVRAFVKTSETITDEDGNVIEVNTVYWESPDSTPSNEASTIPGNVTNVSAAYKDGTTIELKWNTSSDSVTGYIIYSSDTTDDDSNYSVLDTVTKNSITSYLDESIANVGDSRFYRVVAYYEVVIGGSKTKIEGDLSKATTVWECTRPEAPQEVTAVNGVYDTTKQKYTVVVSWEKCDGADGYVIYRSANKKAFEKIGTVAGETTTEYTDEAVQVGVSYTYKVTAYVDATRGGDTVTCESEFSEQTESVSGTSGSPEILNVDPLDPKDASGFKVEWKQEPGASGYYVEAYDSTTYESDTKPGKALFTKQITEASTVTWDVTGLTAGETYVIRVCSYVKNGSKILKSAYTLWEESTDVFEKELWVGVPTKLTQAAVNGTSVKITWDKVYGVEKYRLFVKSTGDKDSSYNNNKGEWYIDIPATTLSYTITGLKSGYEYTVRIGTLTTVDGQPVYTMTTSGNTGIATLLATSDYFEDTKVQARPNKPGTPKAVLSYKDDGTPVIKLTWSGVTGLDANGGYKVYRRVSDGAFNSIKTLALETVYEDEITDPSLVGNVLSYQITSYANPIGTPVESEPSASVLVKVAPQVPVLTIENDQTTGDIVLKWDTIFGVDHYVLHRGGKNSNIKKVVDTVDPVPGGASAVDYQDSAPLEPNGKNYYWLEAVGTGSLTSISKSVVGYQGLVAPSAPTVDYADGNGIFAKSIDLEWSPVTGAKNYVVYYEKDGVKKKAGSTNKTKYRVTKLDYNQEYDFYVTAVNGKRVSAYSDPLTETTALQAVENLTYKVKSPTSIEISWDKERDVNGYYVEWIDPNTSETVKKTVSGNKLTISGLVMAETNDYTVYPYITVSGDKKTDDATKIQINNVASGPDATKSITLSNNTTSTTKIDVSWKEVSEADKYIIRWENTKDATDNGSGSVNGLSYTITGLTSKQKYRIDVVPCLGGVEGVIKSKTVTKK